MDTRRSDILLHPVRLRIVLAAAGDEVTTTDIARRLPDISQATLYRHVAKLADAGILEVADERQARGAVERTYRVNAAHSSINAGDAGDMSAEEHLQALTTFMGIVVEATDGVSFRQARLWLTDGELEGLVTDVTDALAPYLDVEKTPERRPRLLSTILMPEPAPPAE